MKSARATRAHSTVIVNVHNGVFEELFPWSHSRVPALLIHPTTNSNDDIYYFVNPSDLTFRRTLRAPGTTSILAESVTNTWVFQAQELFREPDETATR